MNFKKQCGNTENKISSSSFKSSIKCSAKRKKNHIHVCWQWNSFDLQVFSISSSSEHKKPLTMMDESYLRKEGKYKHQSEIFTKEMCK